MDIQQVTSVYIFHDRIYRSGVAFPVPIGSIGRCIPLPFLVFFTQRFPSPVSVSRTHRSGNMATMKRTHSGSQQVTPGTGFTAVWTDESLTFLASCTKPWSHHLFLFSSPKLHLVLTQLPSWIQRHMYAHFEEKTLRDKGFTLISFEYPTVSLTSSPNAPCSVPLITMQHTSSCAIAMKISDNFIN